METDYFEKCEFKKNSQKRSKKNSRRKTVGKTCLLKQKMAVGDKFGETNHENTHIDSCIRHCCRIEAKLYNQKKCMKFNL